MGTSKPHHCISASELIRNEDGKVLKLKSTHIASFKKSMQENTRISSPCTNFRETLNSEVEWRHGDLTLKKLARVHRSCPPVGCDASAQ